MVYDDGVMTHTAYMHVPPIITNQYWPFSLNGPINPITKCNQSKLIWLDLSVK
ncbi:hypothetical protein M153_1167000166 [Pseudoloma neurophilia]|uniref:Uncharacterized protein n=1 Tax=Pseudoloma neurophilia TaxID=146866 RepID=A0A0R0M2M4_9MICR|nr:hypothetical protein M153_1167000166 [Pseudoloma neurophilia]